MGRLHIQWLSPKRKVFHLGWDYHVLNHRAVWKLKDFNLMCASEDTKKSYLMFQLECLNHLIPCTYRVTLMKNRGDDDDWESLSSKNWQKYSFEVDITKEDIKAYLVGYL